MPADKREPPRATAAGVALDEARMFISEVRWQFAKTMPDWPHEYTVKSWRPDLAERFEALCALIHDRGIVEPWPPPPAATIYRNHYLVIGEHKYWAMGPLGDRDQIDERTIINRAQV